MADATSGYSPDVRVSQMSASTLGLAAPIAGTSTHGPKFLPGYDVLIGCVLFNRSMDCLSTFMLKRVSRTGDA